MVQCTNQQSCQSVVRKHNGKTLITKRCKQTTACLNNMKQNLRPFGKSTQCNDDEINSVCTCCCDKDNCNKGPLDCVKEQDTKPIKAANDVTCQQQGVLPHGEASCSDENKQGSTCEFRCTSPNYSIYPSGADKNQCGANGQWSQPKPCCARPCPPFFLFDAAILHHVSDKRSYPVVQAIRINVVRDNMDINYDTGKLAGLFYNSEPVLETQYNYNEYNDKTQLIQLAVERVKPTNSEDAIVNTGRAMKYAINNMYLAEMGARDSRVPKIMVIITDSNSDDNVKEASDAAIQAGITPYIFAIEHPDWPLNRTQMIEVAGTADRTYFLAGEDANMMKFVDDLTASFCENPCDHVLHEHEK
uniref:Transmembrane matrix receptor MUP-4-like n=1 Tax=Phallusia mammillata TaxID=59560 RepID=A0A6F9DKU8_9ASCI|nr:transmembrane matrix receptor MUP-4-like [Phallusia mammillata]